MKTSVWAFGASVVAVVATAALPADSARSTEAPSVRVKHASSEDPLVGHLMVKLRNAKQGELVQALGANRVAALSASAGVGLKAVRPMAGGASVLALPAPMKLSEAYKVAERLAADPNVEWAEPDRHVRRMQVTPTDPGYTARQWNFFPPTSMFTSGALDGGSAKTFTAAGGVNLPTAWAATQGAATIRVAIIDTGVTLNHPDLSAAILGTGYDFTSASSGAGFGLPAGFLKNKSGVTGRDADGSDPGDWITVQDKTMYPACRGPGEPAPPPAQPYTAEDSSWHGTHMAGIVAAQWNASNAPGTSLAGIAPNVKIIPIRGLGKCGGQSSDIIDAIYWAAGAPLPNGGNGVNNGGSVQTNPNPANVINLSLGSANGACGAAYQAAIDAAIQRGVVVVAATGNSAGNQVLSPANCNNVIAVTAHVINGDNADYANVGIDPNLPQPTISAPGGGRPQQLVPTPAVTNADTAFYVWSTLLFGPTTPTSSTAPPAPAQPQTGPALSGFTGTSPAAPHAGAVAALLLSLSPQLPPAQVRSLITTSARPHPAGGYCAAAPAGTCGAGLLDAGQAVALHNQRRPTVTAEAQTTAASAPVTLSSSVAAGASGGTTYTYQWTQTAGPNVTLSSATAAQPTFTAPIANGPITFTVTATDNNGYRSAAVTKTVTVTGGVDMPAITGQPQSASVTAGQAATFTVTATGTAPLTYQWSRNGTAVNGATAASYTTPATGAADSGVIYTVVVTNAAGSVTSSPATLTVNAAPPPSSGGGGGGSLPLWPVALLAALALARRVRYL